MTLPFNIGDHGQGDVLFLAYPASKWNETYLTYYRRHKHVLELTFIDIQNMK